MPCKSAENRSKSGLHNVSYRLNPVRHTPLTDDPGAINHAGAPIYVPVKIFLIGIRSATCTLTCTFSLYTVCVASHMTKSGISTQFPGLSIVGGYIPTRNIDDYSRLLGSRSDPMRAKATVEPSICPVVCSKSNPQTQ